jgi:DNA recombination protein RmuC
LSETLTRYERGIQQMETERKGAYASLNERVVALHHGHERLEKETRNLVTALRSPHTRGRWGEMTLRRTVEAAGMLEHCDFEEQKTVAGEDGSVRPDMVVHLPGGGQVVIDSKVPLDAFLQFTEADDDDARRGFLEKHAKQLRTHIEQLAKKEYWKQFEFSPEFVVAFIPGEPLLAAALDADPALQEYALGKRIILATPNTLVAALRTIALSWQQETLAENAREVKDLGAELYERLRTWTGHMQALQKSLSSSVDAYNRAVGSLETRVLVTARKFPSLGVVGSERADITELSPIETAPRHLQAVEADDDDADGGEVGQQNILPLSDGASSGSRRLPG